MSYGNNPIFILNLHESKREIRIYANGVVEGVGERSHIVNLIPLALTAEHREFFSKNPFACSGMADGLKDANPELFEQLIAPFRGEENE